MKTITLTFTLLLTTSRLWCAFEINKLGPKASAFNDTYSALGSDPWALLYNPAQVVRLRSAQLALAYSRPHLNFGNFQSNLVSSFYTRQALGTGYGVGIILADTNVFYREITGLLNIGHRVGQEEELWDFAVGANLKVLSLRRGDPSRAYDPALTPRTLNRFTLDVGAHLRLDKFYLGASAQNVVPANIGVTVRDDVPVETRIGIGMKEAYQVPKLDFKISPAVEVTNRNHKTTTSGGLEIDLLDYVKFIAGGSERNFSVGFSVLLAKSMLGSSSNLKPREIWLQAQTVYRIDVSYLIPFNGVDPVGSPLIGLSFIF